MNTYPPSLQNRSVADAHAKVFIRISDLYHDRLMHASNNRRMADNTVDELKRSHLRECAWDLELDASNLAHCIARFGDLQLNKIDFETLRIDAKSSYCHGHNPWIQGLAIIEANHPGAY